MALIECSASVHGTWWSSHDAGRLDRKIRRGGFGHRVEIDQPVLDRERHVIGAVAAGNRDHLAGFPYPKTGAVGGVGGAA